MVSLIQPQSRGKDHASARSRHHTDCRDPGAGDGHSGRGVLQRQLAKQGEYTGRFGWYSVGKTFEIEKDHVFFTGEFSGAFFNDAGKGFLHQTSVICPGINDVRKDISLDARGYCIVTDRDGDKAFLVWQATNPTKPGEVPGTFQWTGGTGKYTGLTGDNTFTGFLLPSSSGYSVWKGKWQLSK